MAKLLLGWKLSNTWSLNSDINDGYPCLQWTDQNCNTPNIDSDGDGVSDAIEDSGPNNGDANNDGTPDRQQDNVVAISNDLTDKVVVLELSDSCEIQTSSIDDTNQYAQQDRGYNYADGMVHFTAIKPRNVLCYASSIRSQIFTAQYLVQKLQKQQSMGKVLQLHITK